MRSFYLSLLLLGMLAMTGTLRAQGFERNLYDLKTADLITETPTGQLWINSSLNQFNLIDRRGRPLRQILHSNNQHPDDTWPGESLTDLNPTPLANGDVIFLSRKRMAENLAVSDVLYFNYWDAQQDAFPIQTTIFLPTSHPDLPTTGYSTISHYTTLGNQLYFALVFHGNNGRRYPLIMQIATTGEPGWTQAYLLPYSSSGHISRLKTLERTPTDRLLLGLEYADFEYYNLELDGDGQEVAGSYFPITTDLDGLNPTAVAYWPQPDGGLIIVGNHEIAGEDDLYVFDDEAELVFSRPWFLGIVNSNELYRIIRQVDGGFVVYFQRAIPGERTREELIISKIDLAGEFVWTHTYVPDFLVRFADWRVLTDGSLIYAGLATDFVLPMPPGREPRFFGYLLKLGESGRLYDSYFQGQTFEDIDEDCTQLVEAPLGRWLVAYQSSQDTLYALSRADASYERGVPPGTYQAQLYPPSIYWDACPPTPGLSIGVEDTLTHHFPAQVEVACPNLAVHLSAPFIRRCFSATYTVNYCNTGTIVAENAYIEVELDPELTYTRATVLPSSIEGQVLRFDLGTLNVGLCANFQIEVAVGCTDVLLGQAHCTTATIYPNTPCVISNEWSGASLAAQATCLGDSVQLSIKNEGSNPNDAPLKYIVIEDQVILLEQDNGGTLNPGDSLLLNYPATGAMYRLEIEQEPNHPGESFPTAFVEGCVADVGAPVSLGFVTQYWEDDADDFVSIDCQENIGSYDPNDKRAYPGGIEIDDIHYIEANQSINYHIRFQNTGTDTAFTVVIKDEIDPNLDLSTLELGASSHAYTLEITPLRELLFTFADIKLVDSFRNEPLSHGFVSFSIDQLPDLEPGTLIENEAAIFFDFNLPIITNTWQHEIAEDILPRATPPTPPEPEVTGLQINPNPISQSGFIRAPALGTEEEATIAIYDSHGRLCRSYTYTGAKIPVQRGQLSAGVYFIEVTDDDGTTQRTKLVIQY